MFWTKFVKLNSFYRYFNLYYYYSNQDVEISKSDVFIGWKEITPTNEINYFKYQSTLSPAILNEGRPAKWQLCLSTENLIADQLFTHEFQLIEFLANA
jgi:hypothetical protein